MKKAKTEELMNPPLVKVKTLGYQAIPWVFNQLSGEDQQELLKTLMYIAGVVRIDTTTTSFEKFYMWKNPLAVPVTTKKQLERAYWYWSQITSQATKLIHNAYDYILLRLEDDHYTTCLSTENINYLYGHNGPYDIYLCIGVGEKHICFGDIMQGYELDKLRAGGWIIEEF